jgi:hypothetical protein
MGEGEGGEYVRRVRAFDAVRVWELWTAIQAGVAVEGWPPGRLMEHLVLRAFELEGARVSWPYEVWLDTSRLEQIDGAVHFEGLSCLIECKAWHHKLVDVAPIIKLKARLARRPASVLGAVFCVTGFSEDALSMVRLLPPANVLLWRGGEFDRALRKGFLCEGMRRKLNHAVEQGFADLDLMEQGVFK